MREGEERAGEESEVERRGKEQRPWESAEQVEHDAIEQSGEHRAAKKAKTTKLEQEQRYGNGEEAVSPDVVASAEGTEPTRPSCPVKAYAELETQDDDIIKRELDISPERTIPKAGTGTAATGHLHQATWLV